jgi:putative spermidine/putrescine transport system substrate-binding protein
VVFDRRQVLKTAAVGAAAFAAPFVLRQPEAKAEGKLNFALWGGSYQEAIETAFLKPFAKETGIQVVAAGAPDFTKVRAQMQTGNIEWDLIVPAGNWETEGAKAGYWEPIDYSVVDMSNTTPAAKPPW